MKTARYPFAISANDSSQNKAAWDLFLDTIPHATIYYDSIQDHAGCLDRVFELRVERDNIGLKKSIALPADQPINLVHGYAQFMAKKRGDSANEYRF